MNVILRGGGTLTRGRLPVAGSTVTLHGVVPPSDHHADQGRADRRVGAAPTWSPPGAGSLKVIGSYRLDDPDGRVGMEIHIVDAGGTILQVPLTYRDEPLVEADEALITEMQHSVLGTRWVYDGLRDPLLVVMLAGVTMTGQGEALGMAVYDGRWYIAPTGVRVQGGGWTLERVPVDPSSSSATRPRAVLAQRPIHLHRASTRPAPDRAPRSGSPPPGQGFPPPSCSPRSTSGRPLDLTLVSDVRRPTASRPEHGMTD